MQHGRPNIEPTYDVDSFANSIRNFSLLYLAAAAVGGVLVPGAAAGFEAVRVVVANDSAETDVAFLKSEIKDYRDGAMNTGTANVDCDAAGWGTHTSHTFAVDH